MEPIFFNALPTAFTVGSSFRAILCKAGIVILDYEGHVGRWWSTGSSSIAACCCWRTYAGRRHDGQVGDVEARAQTLISFARVDGKEAEKN